MGIEAADYRGRLKSHLVPGKAFRSYVVGVHQIGAAERTFCRGNLERGSVRDIDHLAGIAYSGRTDTSEDRKPSEYPFQFLLRNPPERTSELMDCRVKPWANTRRNK